MSSRDFCYWLQGFMEVSESGEINPKQLQIIRNHLNMVFKHEIDPSHGDATHQKALSVVHQGSTPPLPKSISDALHLGLDGPKINC